MIRQIQEIISSHDVPLAGLMIHRTHEPALQSILGNGLRTGIAKYGYLQSTVTLHSGRFEDEAERKDFQNGINQTHRGSTHHAVIALPQHALDHLKKQVEKACLKKTYMNQVNTMLASALGGTLPREWILGHYDRTEKKFVPNPQFDPAFRPKWNGMKKTLEEAQAAKGPIGGKKASGTFVIPQAQKGASQENDVW